MMTRIYIVCLDGVIHVQNLTDNAAFMVFWKKLAALR